MSIYKSSPNLLMFLFIARQNHKLYYVIFFKLPKFPFYLFDCIGVDDLFLCCVEC